MSKTIMSGKQFGVLLGLIILIAFLSIMALDENYRQDQEIEELRAKFENGEIEVKGDTYLIDVEPQVENQIPDNSAWDNLEPLTQDDENN